MGEPLVLWTMTSAGMRIAVAAQEAGLSLSGATIMVGGEAVTDIRRQQIEASGARVLARYTSTELPGLSHGCATPYAPDDMHLVMDRYAVVGRSRLTSVRGPAVNAMLYTSLSLTAPKIALNMESGDYARFEERDCGCLLGARPADASLGDPQFREADR